MVDGILRGLAALIAMAYMLAPLWLAGLLAWAVHHWWPF